MEQALPAGPSDCSWRSAGSGAERVGHSVAPPFTPITIVVSSAGAATRCSLLTAETAQFMRYRQRPPGQTPAAAARSGATARRWARGDSSEITGAGRRRRGRDSSSLSSCSARSPAGGRRLPHRVVVPGRGRRAAHGLSALVPGGLAGLAQGHDDGAQVRRQIVGDTVCV
jgi:hypothetical protein